MNTNKPTSIASNLLNNLIGGRVTQEQKEKYKKIKYEQGDLVISELLSDSQSSDSENECLHQQQPKTNRPIRKAISRRNSINKSSTKQNQTMIIDEDLENIENERTNNIHKQQQQQHDSNQWDSSLPFKYMKGVISFNELTSIMENNFNLTSVPASTDKVIVEEASDLDEEEDDEEDDDFMSGDSDDSNEEEDHFKSAEEFDKEYSVKHKFKNLSVKGHGRRRKLAKDLLGLVGQANLHFVRGDHDGAIEMCLEVIRLAPHSPEPFQTLSLIYEEKREFEKAYQFSLISAYLNPSDGDNWIKNAEMAVELKQYSQAILCYNRAIKVYPKNLALHMDRCKLYKLCGDNKRAMDGYESLFSTLNKEPDSPQIQEMCLQTAKEIAMLHYFNKNIDLSIEVMEENLEKYRESIINEDVNLYLELLISNDQYVKTLNMFKKYCGINIKVNGEPVDLTQQHVDEKRDEIEINLGPSELQIDLRAKLVVCLINLRIFDRINELKDFITKENVEEMGDLYSDIADAYIKINLIKEAEPLLGLLVHSKTYNVASVWLKYARILRDLDKLVPSMDAYYEVVKQLPKSIEAKLELRISDILVKLDRVADATGAIGELNNNQINLDLLLVRCNLLFKQKMYEEFITAGKILLASELTFLANESEMLIMITSTSQKCRIENLRDLYNKQGDILDVSELTSNDYNFVGNQLTADDLADIFSKYCCALVETKKYQELIKMVFSAYTSNLYGKKSEYYDFLAMNACYLTRNTAFLYKMSKTFLFKNVNNNQLWNFFSAIMLNIYQDFRHNRFCIRMSLKNQNNIPLAFINGHNALTSGNYKVAMAEYVHIFKQNPSDPFVILCILVVFTHLTCQKFIANKHSVVAQLCAFMNLYLEVRGECKESLYNVGRSFHQLGLEHEAMHFYKRALEIEDQIECDAEEEEMLNLNGEIAFNLSLIYMNSGNSQMALYYTRKYFVV